MASIKFSGIGVTDIRGKLGGTVFGRSAGGANIRRNAKPISRKTTAASSVKTKLSSVAGAWQGLSDAQKAAWNSFAAAGFLGRKNKMGETVTLSGFQAYLEINLNLKDANQAVLAAPVTLNPAIITTGLAVGTLTAISILATITVTGAAGYQAVVYASPCSSPGTSTAKTFRRLTNVPAETIPDLITAFSAVYGAPVAGTVVYFKFKLVSETSGATVTSATVRKVVS